MSQKKRRYYVERYRQEAEKEPFVLNTEDGREVTIPQPTVGEVLEMTSLTDPREQLQMIAKDQYDALLDAIKGLPGSALPKIIKDLTAHYGLGE